MTQPAEQKKGEAITELPKANFPTVNRMLSEPAYPDPPGTKSEPLMWQLNGKNPMVDGYIVARMFRQEFGVEVYSVMEGQGLCLRLTIPWERIYCAEEAMNVDIFIAELQAAENENLEEPDGRANGVPTN